MNLSAASLLYRHPELYDAMCHPDTDTIAQLVTIYGLPSPGSVLDVGCGTGNLLADLPDNYETRVGVDLQPAMIEYIRHARPHLDVRAADLRTVRLGRAFDAIICVGLTLAYLHTETDLDAASATFAAHAHRRTALVIHTLIELPHDLTPRTGTAMLAGQPATVSTTYEWNDPILTMRRRWDLTDAEPVEDLLQRRVWPSQRLAGSLARAGFARTHWVGDRLIAVRA